MTITVDVLFGRPQQEIASILRAYLAQCRAAWIVTGFATVEGVEAIAPAFRSSPTKLQALVIGAGTERGFEALDRLLSIGVPQDRLFVHLGHTRSTGAGATHRFYRYHPMLHSKVYLLEMDNGQAVAFIGSHNVTGFALMGLNGEAGVLLRGGMSDPESQRIRQHIEHSRSQSAPYSTTMKDAFSWWTCQFVDGLRAKVQDRPKDSEGKKTIVVLGVVSGGSLPQKNDVIYFEIPSGLGQVLSLQAEVHLYLLGSKPSSPLAALSSLSQATRSFWCKTLGLELERGGVELRADWHIPDRSNPVLVPAPRPFRPAVSPNMQQVRVSVKNDVWKRYEYLFQSDKVTWEPVFDEEQSVQANPEAGKRDRQESGTGSLM